MDANVSRGHERVCWLKVEEGVRRQLIEAKALRKLKHPSRSRKLRSFLDN
jgi:hypothetical protein